MLERRLRRAVMVGGRLHACWPRHQGRMTVPPDGGEAADEGHQHFLGSSQQECLVESTSKSAPDPGSVTAGSALGFLAPHWQTWTKRWQSLCCSPLRGHCPAAP